MGAGLVGGILAGMGPRWRRGIGAAGWRVIAAVAFVVLTAMATLIKDLDGPGVLWIALLVAAAVDAVAGLAFAVREQTQPRRERQQSVRGWLDGHFLPRARGMARTGEHSDLFSGRTVAREELVGWLTAPTARGEMCVVTGDPGSGKSAVLGRLVAQSNRRLRRALDLRHESSGSLLPEGTIDAVVHARELALDEVAEAIAAQVGASGTAPEQLAGEGRARPRVVVVDALDEASGEGEARRIAQRLLRPLADAGARVLVGTRRGPNGELLAALGAGRRVIDLDEERYLDPDDLDAYVRRLLLRGDDPAAPTPYRGRAQLAERVARAVAERATPSFLVARLVGRSLAQATDVVDVHQPGWAEAFPATVANAMDDYLDCFESEPDRRRARDLLGALACAEGAGLPFGHEEDLWSVVGAALHGSDFSREDIAWLLGTPAADLVVVARGEPGLYRLFHQALVDHLRPTLDRSAAGHQRIARALRACVVDDWSPAPSYIREHLATHAAAGGCLDHLLEDADYLLAAEPVRLLRALPSATAPQAAVVRRVYRVAAANVRASVRSERAAYLELAARQAGEGRLADRFAGLEPSRPWAVPWAALRPVSEHYLLGAHHHPVSAVAGGELDGHPIVVSGCSDGTLAVWDLETGRQRGEPLTGHDESVMAVAVGALDGSPIAVSGSQDGTLRVWDLETGHQRGATLTGHDGFVAAVAVGELDGRPICVSAGWDWTLRIWDLETGRQHGAPLTLAAVADTSSHNRQDAYLSAVAVSDLDGHPIAVSGGLDGTVRVWDLETGRQRGAPLTAVTDADTDATREWSDDEVKAVALGGLDGHPIAVSGGSWDGTLRVWDLETGRQRGEPLTGHDRWVSAAAVGVLDGHPIVVSGSGDSTLRVWDLETGRQRGEPLTGHDNSVEAIAVSRLDGRPIVVSGGFDGTLRVWDLETDRQHGQLFTGHHDRAVAVAVGRLAGRSIAASGSWDGTLRVWDLDTGRQQGAALTGHHFRVEAVALGDLAGRPIAVSGSGTESSECGTLRPAASAASRSLAITPPPWQASQSGSGRSWRWRSEISTGTRSSSPAAGTGRCECGTSSPAASTASR